MNLFGEAAKTIDKFNLAISEDFNLDEKLNKEKEFLGFYLSSHPLDRYKDILITFSIKKLSEFDLEGYLREQKQLTEETTTTSNKKPLINDIFGQSEVKDTFVSIPVSTKKSNSTTANVKKPLANTGISTSSTAFFGLASLLAAFILRRKFNK